MDSNKNIDLARKAFPYHRNLRVAYMAGLEEGYEQAIKDFTEKAVKWLAIHMPFGEVSHESVYDCIQEFKNYMQDESEN